MEVKASDIFTPANALSTSGLALTIVGSANIDRVSGIAMIGAGRVLDLADGYVARRTHASDLGALVDATFDKLAVTAIVIQSWRHDAAPEAALALVATFNVVNALANIYTDRKGVEARSSKDGKWGMFGQNVALGSYALANALNGNIALEVAGGAAMLASAPFAVRASRGYIDQAIKARQAQPKTQKSFTRRKR